MEEIRCTSCKRLLLKAVIIVGEVKCKCGCVNKVKRVTQDVQKDFSKIYNA